MQPTFDQAFQMLSIAREAHASLEVLQDVYNAGLLSDLLKAENPAAVNREEFRRVLGYGPSVFKVEMGGPETTDQITANLGFMFDKLINQQNFPLEKAKTLWEDEIEIVDPGYSFSEKEGLQILKNKGLLRPTYEHSIRFAQQHGKTVTSSERKPSIIFLHEAWQDQDRSRRVMCLNRNLPYHRVFDLSYLGGTFCGGYVLAGVRSHKQSSAV